MEKCLTVASTGSSCPRLTEQAWNEKTRAHSGEKPIHLWPMGSSGSDRPRSTTNWQGRRRNGFRPICLSEVIPIESLTT